MTDVDSIARFHPARNSNAAPTPPRNFTPIDRDYPFLARRRRSTTESGCFNLIQFTRDASHERSDKRSSVGFESFTIRILIFYLHILIPRYHMSYPFHSLFIGALSGTFEK